MDLDNPSLSLRSHSTDFWGPGWPFRRELWHNLFKITGVHFFPGDRHRDLLHGSPTMLHGP
jgi:hypothetical protein